MTTCPKAFRNALLAVTPNLRAYARSLCGAPDLADDLVQDTLLKAWEKQHMLKETDRLLAWTMTIMRNHFRAQHRRGKFMVEDIDGGYTDSLYSSGDQETSCDLSDVANALEKLPAELREALVVVFVHELSYEEGARVLNCPTGTLKSRVSRARVQLAELLEWSTHGGGALPEVVQNGIRDYLLTSFCEGQATLSTGPFL